MASIHSILFRIWTDYKERATNDLIRLNISGTAYEFDKITLETKGRATLLQRFATLPHSERIKLCDNYQEKPQIYCIWHNAKVFGQVLSFMTTGHLRCPEDMCPDEFFDELKFWEVDLRCLPPCCRSKLDFPESELPCCLPILQIDETEEAPLIPVPTEETQLENSGLKAMEIGSPPTLKIENTVHQPEVDQFEGIFLGKYRRVIWNTFEDPSSGPVAKLLMAISAGFVFISVLILILGSMQTFQERNIQNKDNNTSSNSSKEPIAELVYTEYVCVIWFTFEYVTRLSLTPNRLAFMKSPINIVDALSLFPFYVEVCFLLSGKKTEDLQNWKGALLALRILRVFRVARVLKLARYSGGLKSFGMTLSSSKKEIGMLLMFLSTAMLLFSTSVYFFEKDHEQSPFTSIPATFWWAVVTMTTVGYGDMIPVSFGGKIVASFATISGVIVLAFPITMIVENFSTQYHNIEPEEAENHPQHEHDQKRTSVHVRSVAIV